MKVLGISCGRVMGNSEILVKEALMGAEEVGAEVEFLRLNDFYIGNCIACGACGKRENPDGIHDCVHDDDFPLLFDRMLDADGIIICAPIYVWAPSGNIRILADRIGPYHDVVLMKNEGKHLPGSTIDPRLFKERKGAYMSVGGTSNYRYASMGLGPMRQTLYPMRVQIVDQQMVLDSTMPGHVLKHPDAIQRAHDIGRHVAEAIGKPEEECAWQGEEGICPGCHNNMLMIYKDINKVKCPWCAIDGELVIDENGGLHADFSKADLNKRHESADEMASHGREIGAQIADWFAHAEEWQPIADKYKEIKFPQAKPSVRKYKFKKG